MIRIKTVGFRYTRMADTDAGAVVDCRHLRNPFSVHSLRYLDGKNPAVRAYVERDPGFADTVKKAKHAAMYSGGGDGICYIGCYGGTHRSVVVAEAVVRFFRGEGVEVQLEHTRLKSFT